MTKTTRTVLLLVFIVATIIYSIVRPKRPPAGPQEEGEFISLVCLLKAPRALTENGLSDTVGRALGVRFDPDNPDATEFVVAIPPPPDSGLEEGQGQTFAVKTAGAVFFVHSFSVPYVERPQELADSLPDPQLREAVASHRAWLSVDFVGELTEFQSRTDVYRTVGRIMAALADDDCLVVYSPERDYGIPYDPGVLDVLRSDDPLTLFPSLPRVVDVADDDPDMLAAMKEARNRWPECVRAFRSGAGEDRRFLVKAGFGPAGDQEFMWVRVQRIDEENVHGTLLNAPRDVPGLSRDAAVTIPIADVCDWLYVDGERTVGGFTDKVLEQKVKAEERRGGGRAQ